MTNCRFVLAWAAAVAVSAGSLVAAQPRPTETGFVQVEDDVRIFYQRFGTGTPTLFVPNRVELIHTFAPLFKRFDAVTWDPRGRGLSSRPDDLSRYGIDAELSDVEALRRHVGAEQVDYVGVSLWANIALVYAARHPDQVNRVVALSPLAVSEAAMGPPADPITHDLSSQEAELEAIEEDGVDPDERYRRCVVSQYLTFAGDYVDLEDMEPMVRANTCQYANEHPDQIEPVVFEGMFGDWGAWDFRQESEMVEAPTLIVFGGRENWDLTGVRAYGELIPSAGLAELPGAGHHVWNDERPQVLAMLEDFLAGEWPGGVEEAPEVGAAAAPTSR